VLRTGRGKPQLITDFMGYNTAVIGGFQRSSGLNWVSDLMVECEVAVEKAEGELTLELSRGEDRFQARFDLGSGACKLVRIHPLSDKEKEAQAEGQGPERKEKETGLAEKQTELKKPGTYRLRFADFDQRLTVWVGDALPFGDGVVFDPPATGGPREANDLERPAGVGSKGAAVRLSQLQVWRDTYYTVAADQGPGAADVPGVDFGDPAKWGDLADMPVRTMKVQPGHYLCMGDNSPESSDGRTWGLVPERLLLGRALLVYYPFNRAGRIH
jgi:signal peptidase I